MKPIIFTLLILLSFCACKDTSSTNKMTKLQKPEDKKIYFGAFADFGGSEDNVSTQKVKAFERLIDKKIAWAYFSNNWYKGVVYPREAIRAIQASGATPFVRLMPRSAEEQGFAEVRFAPENIIDGEFDDELRQWAGDAKEDNIPLLVDFSVEPNGDWFGWSGIFHGGGISDEYGDENYPDGPERYRDAYRHIITLFREVGVNNITWFFHFNYTSLPDEEWNAPHYYYPGDDYIDWVGFSLYGAQTLSEEWEGLGFSEQLARYAQEAKAVSQTKPIALLEFGVTDNHKDGSKSAWLEDAFATIMNNPYITFSAISAWHENWENEDETISTIRLDSSTETLDTFRKNIANERFSSQLQFKKE